MKVESVMIPRYPGETDSEYIVRKEDMLRFLARAPEPSTTPQTIYRRSPPPLAYVVHHPRGGSSP